MGKVIEVQTEEEFNQYLEDNKDKKFLLDFYAQWCGPCKMLSPQLDIVAEETDADVVKIDVDKLEGVAGEYGVMSIPALKVIENGEVVHEQNGFSPAEQIKTLL